MKEVYIVLTHTGTILSRVIKMYTKDEFSHVSIALDSKLERMYSFGRLNPYNPFIGGFVHEYIDKGTFKRFYNTETKIYSLEVTDEQYEKIEKTINSIQEKKDKYKFNILGMFASGFRKRRKKEYSFYCAEFVRYVMEESDVKTGLPEIVKPEDFKDIAGLEVVYSGLLREFNK